MCASSFEKTEYDLVKCPSKDVLSSCPVACHQLKQVIVNAWDGYADACEACKPLSAIPNGPNHTNSLPTQQLFCAVHTYGAQKSTFVHECKLLWDIP